MQVDRRWPGTECEYAFGNSCAPNGGNTEQFSSTNDTFANNSFTDNGAGVIVEGSYDPSIVGPADPDAAYGNAFYANSWNTNLIANVADFSGFSATPVTNSYGTPTADIAASPVLAGRHR